MWNIRAHACLCPKASACAHTCAHACAHACAQAHMRARGRCTPPISLIPFACAPLSIIGQHAKGIGVKDGVERPRARMFLILDVLGGRQCKCRPFDSTSFLTSDRVLSIFKAWRTARGMHMHMHMLCIKYMHMHIPVLRVTAPSASRARSASRI